MLKIIVIPADEDQPIETREVDGELHTMQQIVGGLIQPVDIDAVKATIWANEEGLLIDLPPNVRATAFLYFYAPEHRGYTYLTGDTYLTGQPDKNGNTKNVPAEVAKVFELDA